MTESSNHTFYSAVAAPVSPRPRLTQNIEADVCVVGGGFAGLWAAHALAARGHDVVVLEAGEVAGGASGQNGGFVSAGYAASLERIVARAGLDHARELYRLSRNGVEIVRALISGDMDAVQAQPGRLHVQRHDGRESLSAHAEMLARDFGHELEFWDKERVRRTLVSDRYFQALHEADAFHLNPLALARRLAAEIEERGGRIFEGSRVVEADVDGLRKSLATDEGSVRAFHVVLAGSASIGGTFPWLAKTILPIRTHVAVTAPSAKNRKAIHYEGAIADTRRAGDYYHLIGDRLLWGGRISARRNPPRYLARSMAKDIARVYPELGEAEIEYAWSGVMGYAVHMMPQIGNVRPGVWVSSAFGGQGLNTTAMAGELIASAIAEQDDRWRLFVPFGLVWSGGAAGRMIAQASYWGMQASDWREETRARAAERDEEAVQAGLAPGLAAHAVRRSRERFLGSRTGRAVCSAAKTLRRVALAVARPVLRAGKAMGAAAVIIGRALAPAARLFSSLIGSIARVTGRGMESAAIGLATGVEAAGNGLLRFWRGVLVPSANRALLRLRDIRRQSVKVPQEPAPAEEVEAAEPETGASETQTVVESAEAVDSGAESKSAGKTKKKKKKSKDKDQVEA